MEVWYNESGKPEGFNRIDMSEPIDEDFLSVKCECCATDKDKDAAARHLIIQNLTRIINDLSNDAAPLLLIEKMKGQ
jgi:hypothetical protein